MIACGLVVLHTIEIYFGGLDAKEAVRKKIGKHYPCGTER